MQHLSRRGFLATTGGVFAGLMGSGGAAAMALGSAAGTRRRAGETYFQVRELGPGTWAIIGEGGNTLLSLDQAGSILVDTKNAPFGQVLLEDAARLGADAANLTVINTHHHGDHTAGNHAFKGKCRIVAHKNVPDRIKANMDWYGSMAGAGMRQLRTIPADKIGLAQSSIQDYAGSIATMTPDDWKPTVAVDDQAQTGGGNAQATLRHFGAGHTDNDIVVRMKNQNLLHTGDLLFHNLHPYFDETAGFNCQGWIGSLWKIHSLCDAQTVVLPGHGEVTNREGVRGGIDYLEALWDAVNKGIDAGKSREDLGKETFAFMEGKGFEQARERAIVNVYDEATSLR